mgnify:CR=1 FL=1
MGQTMERMKEGYSKIGKCIQDFAVCDLILILFALFDQACYHLNNRTFIFCHEKYSLSINSPILFYIFF